MERIAVVIASLTLALAVSGCNGTTDLENLVAGSSGDVGFAPATGWYALVDPDAVAEEAETLDDGDEPDLPPLPKRKPALSSAEAHELQASLQRLGYDPGPVDGIIGPLTRKALRAWLTNTGQSDDGKITPDLVVRLRQQVASLDQGSRAQEPGGDEAQSRRSMLRRLLRPLFGS